jgi:hypothetical protein
MVVAVWDTALKVAFPTLFGIARAHDASVADNLRVFGRCQPLERELF